MDTKSDAELVALTRDGNTTAYTALWLRYSGAGRAAALSFTQSFDPDDLVAEAYTKILERILAGGGPTTAFRAYLLRTIQNIAISWSRRNTPLPLEILDDLADEATVERSMEEAFDHAILARAFAALPERWRRIIWLTEIDGRKPRELAAEFAMTPNAVAALAVRAREGLRQSWISAHLRPVGDGPGHQWTISRLGKFVRGKPSPRERARLLAHLRDCTACSDAADEARRIAASLLPLGELPALRARRDPLHQDIADRDVEITLWHGRRTPSFDQSPLLTAAILAGRILGNSVARRSGSDDDTTSGRAPEDSINSHPAS